MRARIIGLVMVAQLFAPSVQAGSTPDPMPTFRAALEKFRDAASDTCAGPGNAFEAGNNERGIFGPARNVVLTGMNASSNPEKDIAPILQTLVDASKDINAAWPDESRFHYKLFRFPSLFVVQISFRDKEQFFALGKPAKPQYGKAWINAGESIFEDQPRGQHVEITPLKSAADGKPRFLTTLTWDGCAGNTIGVKYEVYEWNVGEGTALDTLLSQHGVLNLVDYEEVTETDSSGKPSGKARFSSVGKLTVSDSRLSLPYCEFSSVDWWDYATLCYLDTYDLSPNGIRYVSTQINRPDFNTVAKVTEYAHRHDIQALAGYTTTETLARQLVTAMSADTMRADMGYAVKHVSSSKEILFPAEEGSGASFTLEKINDRWLVDGFKEQSCDSQH